MLSQQDGEYIVLVVAIEKRSDATWRAEIDDSVQVPTFPLTPLRLIARLWKSAETGTIRRTIQLHGTDHRAPIQTNTQLEQLVRAWLAGEVANDDYPFTSHM